jgi:hypothetical protein
MPNERMEPLNDRPVPLIHCEAVGCERPADWVYTGESNVYLCGFHGDPRYRRRGEVGWTRIQEQIMDRGARDG